MQHGDYLYFVDSDDFIKNDVIEYLYNICKKYNVSYASCRPMDIYEYNFKVRNIKEEITIFDSKDMIKKLILLEDRMGTIWNKLIRADLFNGIRFENRILDDVPIIHKLIIKANKIAYSNQIKYYYYRHSDSITQKQDDDRLIDLYKATIERHEYFKKEYSNFIENDIGVMFIILMIYTKGEEKTKNFLSEQKALDLFKKLFTFEVFKCNIKLKEKLKMVLFRISPKSYMYISREYNNIRYKRRLK